MWPSSLFYGGVPGCGLDEALKSTKSFYHIDTVQCCCILPLSGYNLFTLKSLTSISFPSLLPFFPLSHSRFQVTYLLIVILTEFTPPKWCALIFYHQINDTIAHIVALIMRTWNYSSFRVLVDAALIIHSCRIAHGKPTPALVPWVLRC